MSECLEIHSFSSYCREVLLNRAFTHTQTHTDDHEVEGTSTRKSKVAKSAFATIWAVVGLDCGLELE